MINSENYYNFKVQRHKSSNQIYFHSLVACLGSIYFGYSLSIANLSWNYLILYYGFEYNYVLIARFIQGIVVGVNSMLIPRYLREISPINLSGVTGIMNQGFINFGILIGFVLGYCKFIEFIDLFFKINILNLKDASLQNQNDLTWNLIIFFFPCALSLLRLIFLLFVYRLDTAQYYFQINDKEKAKKVINQTYTKEYQQEIFFMVLEEENYKNESEDTWSLVFSKQYRERLIIGCLLQVYNADILNSEKALGLATFSNWVSASLVAFFVVMLANWHQYLISQFDCNDLAEISQKTKELLQIKDSGSMRNKLNSINLENERQEIRQQTNNRFTIYNNVKSNFLIKNSDEQEELRSKQQTENKQEIKMESSFQSPYKTEQYIQMQGQTQQKIGQQIQNNYIQKKYAFISRNGKLSLYEKILKESQKQWQKIVKQMNSKSSNSQNKVAENSQQHHMQIQINEKNSQKSPINSNAKKQTKQKSMKQSPETQNNIDISNSINIHNVNINTKQNNTKHKTINPIQNNENTIINQNQVQYLRNQNKKTSLAKDLESKISKKSQKEFNKLDKNKSCEQKKYITIQDKQGNIFKLEIDFSILVLNKKIYYLLVFSQNAQDKLNQQLQEINKKQQQIIQDLFIQFNKVELQKNDLERQKEHNQQNTIIQNYQQTEKPNEEQSVFKQIQIKELYLYKRQSLVIKKYQQLYLQFLKLDKSSYLGEFTKQKDLFQQSFQKQNRFSTFQINHVIENLKAILNDKLKKHKLEITLNNKQSDNIENIQNNRNLIELFFFVLLENFCKFFDNETINISFETALQKNLTNSNNLTQNSTYKPELFQETQIIQVRIIMEKQILLQNQVNHSSDNYYLTNQSQNNNQVSINEEKHISKKKNNVKESKGMLRRSFSNGNIKEQQSYINLQHNGHQNYNSNLSNFHTNSQANNQNNLSENISINLENNEQFKNNLSKINESELENNSRQSQTVSQLRNISPSMSNNLQYKKQFKRWKKAQQFIQKQHPFFEVLQKILIQIGPSEDIDIQQNKNNTIEDTQFKQKPQQKIQQINIKSQEVGSEKSAEDNDSKHFKAYENIYDKILEQDEQNISSQIQVDFQGYDIDDKI
ncbi:Major facilitator superfamily domain, general substrate transporter [Pseudocohnilembus persalinus]|uniref:Major facilitator superfamily domain, general substrate transporter n=1 Tax=Pseudocohnilembus persalinus TaxID=266149 RepID=A0A0V0QNW1_PSEPJ|nr:Major facilitator superfamily domain, general substrate transporter [Pseudocohnilembus persalinus]|eukprot:KRX03993.1 Major facilitator superfamily domain, general substrate transporter [Pseudocohnilembus persalinus]